MIVMDQDIEVEIGIITGDDFIVRRGWITMDEIQSIRIGKAHMISIMSEVTKKQSHILVNRIAFIDEK